MPLQAVLKINSLSLFVRIGCTPDERLKKQEIRISFQVKPGSLPTACLTDELKNVLKGELENSICYETLIASTARLIDSRSEFKTVEKVAYESFQNLKDQLPQDALLSVVVTKVAPPIDLLKGEVDFQLSDEGFHP